MPPLNQARRSRRLRRMAGWSLALSVFAPSCGGLERFGGLMLEIDRDPELVLDSFSVAVTTETRVLEPVVYELDESDYPATLGVTTSGEDAMVRLHIVAFREGEAVDVRDLKVERIPKHEVKLVRVYFSASCSPLVTVEGGEPSTTCSSGKTCDPETASCTSGTLDASKLPTYEDRPPSGTGGDGSIDGGGGGPSVGGTGGGGQGEPDPLCVGRSPGAAYCSDEERYECGANLLLSETTPLPCDSGQRCAESAGYARCVSACAVQNGGCSETVKCMDTPDGAQCGGCTDGAFSPSGDGQDCMPRTDCEPGQFVADPGSATSDRICAPCEGGTFSATSNQTTCTPWQQCPGAFVEDVAGDSSHDRSCVDSGIRYVSSGRTDEVYSVARSPSGVLCEAGHVSGVLPGEQAIGGEDAFIACFNPVGELLWLDQFGTPSADAVNQIIFDWDENVIVGGVTEGELASEAMGGTDAFVRKYSPTGKILWTKQWGNRGADGVQGLAVTSGGALIAAGFGAARSGSFGGGEQVSLMALSDAGAELWSQQFGSDGADRALGVVADEAGGFFVVGEAAGSFNQSNQAGPSTFLRRYAQGQNDAWEEAWSDQFGAGSSAVGRALAYDSIARRVVIVGDSSRAFGEKLTPNSAGNDVFVRSYLDETEEFTVSLGSPGEDHGNAIGLDVGGAIWIAADIRGNAGSGSFGATDVLLAEITSEGRLGGTSTFGTSANDYVNALALVTEGIWLAIDTRGNFEGVDGSDATAALLFLTPRPSLEE